MVQTRSLCCWAVSEPGSKVRRSQMSLVFHVVRTTAPGVPVVPKPPGLAVQAASEKSGAYQFAGGALVVNFQSCPLSWDVGTIALKLYWPDGARMAARVRWRMGLQILRS